MTPVSSFMLMEAVVSMTMCVLLGTKDASSLFLPPSFFLFIPETKLKA